ncbi:alpha-amylase family glycosyl hydrolase [soil metagenome]
MTQSWWQSGTIYQIYPRSFKDSNDDGVGDLKGIEQRLDYLSELGFDAIWISPFYKSPMKDFGYDVADFCSVDPIFGSLADFDALVEAAHRLKIRVIVDMVPNHTSSEHEWFIESRSSKNSSKRDWYVWRDAASDGSAPNNWGSFFGGPAWTRDEKTDQYYLHHFLAEQPDLNYRNQEVVESILSAMRFWLDRGVDGFRMDVLWMLVEHHEFLDEPINPDWLPHLPDNERTVPIYRESQPETFEVVAKMRHVLDSYSTEETERIMIGEIYLSNSKLMKYYGTTDKPLCHLPFNFSLLVDGLTDWRAPQIAKLIDEYYAHLPSHGWPNWVLGNHDRSRISTLIGAQQARVATMLLFTLRGTPTWYYGDELGIADVSIPIHKQKDPAGLRQPHVLGAGRDRVRTPMQWDSTAYSGFSNVEPWLPQSPDAAYINVESQLREASSLLSVVKTLLAVRKSNKALSEGTLEQLSCTNETLQFERRWQNEVLHIELNLTDHLVPRLSKSKPLVSTIAGALPSAETNHLRANEGLICKMIKA